ncbi:hypothetical protein ASC97_29880 [Rhizobium sp. Root1203]|uniref:hypothetical protein n=1 Tax=Rhizobium sp. Root1203 TaxID=1736427 RepID=UPI00070EDBA5|nr:hypothetical protein [Rhizobium sp. Root1203]KQV18269.1 hypothetical protein ASC97_29880 [Rhizobium sp. Root1203]
MSRFVLFHRTGQPEEAERLRIQALPGVQLIDGESKRAMLVEMPDEQVEAVTKEVGSDWLVAREDAISSPNDPVA